MILISEIQQPNVESFYEVCGEYIEMLQVLNLSTWVEYLISYSIEYSSSCFEQNGAASKIVCSFFIILVLKIIPNSITNSVVNVHFNYN